MTKLDRLQQLHRIFESHRRPVALKKIAARLECTERTAHRLIEDLQNYFNAPVEYSRDQNGWYYDLRSEKFELPGLWLTGEELLSLALLLGLLENLGDGLLGEELGVVENRIHRLLAARGIDPAAFAQHIKVLPMARRHVPGRVFQQVGEALLQRRRLNIRYKSFSRQTSIRTVSPQKLVHYRDNWYLDAWCHLRNDLRVFSLARIVTLEPVDAPAQMIATDDLERHFGESYGIFAGKGTNIARLRFLPAIAREIAMQQWHPLQEAFWDGDDFLLSFPYGNSSELLGDIMRYLPNVVIEGPASLRKDIQQRLYSALTLYE